MLAFHQKMCKTKGLVLLHATVTRRNWVGSVERWWSHEGSGGSFSLKISGIISSGNCQFVHIF